MIGARSCRRFRSDRFAGYFRRASTLDFSSKEVTLLLSMRKKKGDASRVGTKTNFLPLFYRHFGADPANTTLQKRADAPSAWELFRGRSISGRVNIDSLGGAALVATPQGWEDSAERTRGTSKDDTDTRGGNEMREPSDVMHRAPSRTVKVGERRSTMFVERSISSIGMDDSLKELGENETKCKLINNVWSTSSSFFFF